MLDLSTVAVSRCADDDEDVLIGSSLGREAAPEAVASWLADSTMVGIYLGMEMTGCRRHGERIEL